jgi:phage regulator Rha-like protein
LVAKAQHDTAEFKAAMTALRAEGMSVKAAHLTHMDEMKHVLEIEKKQDQKQHDMLNTVNKIEHQMEAKAAQVAQQLQAVEKGAAAVASAAAVLPRGLENSKKAR